MIIIYAYYCHNQKWILHTVPRILLSTGRIFPLEQANICIHLQPRLLKSHMVINFSSQCYYVKQNWCYAFSDHWRMPMGDGYKQIPSYPAHRGKAWYRISALGISWELRARNPMQILMGTVSWLPEPRLWLASSHLSGHREELPLVYHMYATASASQAPVWGAIRAGLLALPELTPTDTELSKVSFKT